MLIELIGCTSAGKSTLTKELLHASASSADAVAHRSAIQTSYDSVLARFGLGWLRTKPIRMAALNGITLPFALLAIAKAPSLFWLLATLLRQLPASSALYERLKIARITLRNLGIDQILANSVHDRVVLADEGTVQAVHYLFVHLQVPPSLADIDRYLTTVQLPDVVVYFRQPQELLVERTNQRGHKRVQPHTAANVTQFIAHASRAFEHVAAAPILQQRLLIIDGPTNTIVQAPESTAAQAVAKLFSSSQQELIT